MPQVLGRPYLRSQRVTATARFPAYDVLLRVPAADLPSGSGSSKDYLVVVSAKIGALGGSGFVYNTISRIGLRMGPTVFFGTVHQVHHEQSPLQSNGRPNEDRAMPYFALLPIEGWPANTDLEVFADHVELGSRSTFATSFSDVMVWVIDLNRYGAIRGTPGGNWDGTKVKIRSTAYVGGTGLAEAPSWTNILSTGLLSASDGEWLLLYSALIMPKGVPGTAGNTFGLRAMWPSTDTWTPAAEEIELGIGYRARGNQIGTGAPNDGLHIYSAGSMVPFTVTNNTTSVRLQGTNTSVSVGSTACRIFEACIVALRIGELDGYFAEFTPGFIQHATATHWNTQAAQLPVWESTRDMPALAFWSSITPSGDYIGGRPPFNTAVRGWANINGWAETGIGSNPADNLAIYAVPGLPHDKSPITSAALVRPVRAAPEGGVLANIDFDANLDTEPPPYTYSGYDRKVVAFNLSDFGPATPPTPPTLTEIVLVPAREADVSALPEFTSPPSKFAPLAVWESWQQLRSESGYEIRWGDAIGPREIASVEWVDLPKAAALVLWEQLTRTWPRAIKYRPEEDLASAPMRPWIVRPHSARLTAEQGLYRIAVEIIELTYFTS